MKHEVDKRNNAFERIIINKGRISRIILNLEKGLRVC